jgi:sarcosine oxidase / L-pipecolate oxidase
VPRPKAQGENDDVSWRIGDVRELRDIQEEASIASKL